VATPLGFWACDWPILPTAALESKLHCSRFAGLELGKIQVSNEKMNANYHRAFQLGEMNVPMASARLGMLCLDSDFTLLARFLPQNGHRLGMTVTQLIIFTI